MFYLNRLKILRVDQCNYLGIMINIKNCDINIKRQMRKFYANINILLRKLSKCSPDVKCTLFKVFSSNMYCSTLWYNCTVTAMKRLRIAYNNITVSVDYWVFRSTTVQVKCLYNLILNHLVN